MPINELDLNKLSSLITLQVDQVTCIECCKYYIVPTTASCGHTLCHGCWSGRKICAFCGSSVDRKALKLNLPLQNQTEHAHMLVEEFEKTFHVKHDDFFLETPIIKNSTEDSTKNVKDWLHSSENQFSAPLTTQQSTQDLNNHPVEIASKIQIHNKSSKITPTKNTVHIEIPQDDWDKIEEMPDTEDVCQKDKENVVGPTDIEPFILDQFEFSIDKPRRSSRKRNSSTIPTHDIDSIDKNSTKNLSSENDQKTIKSKQNWANVKRMKKEFSRLNKKKKNKLNVSIEMCKKTQSSANKNMPVGNVNSPDDNMPVNNINSPDDLVLHINENTPNVDNPKICSISTQNLEKDQLLVSDKQVIKNHKPGSELEQIIKHDKASKLSHVNDTDINMSLPKSNTCSNNKIPAVTFVMKGPLHTATVKETSIEIDGCNDDNQHNIQVATENMPINTDDIEITIKIGNTLTNICIKKNEKDVQLQINTDKEIQTSLDKCIASNKKNVSCSPINQTDCSNNVVFTIQNNVQKATQPNLSKAKECEKSFKMFKQCAFSDKNVSVVKTSSTKKNTESADTATAQYEITESIEKELSTEMEKVDAQVNQSFLKYVENTNVGKEKSGDNVLDEDCVNDLDLFDNDSVKEGYVQSLKSSNRAPSEILVSTMKSYKSKNVADKRPRDEAVENLPASKKMKSIQEDVSECEQIINTSKTNQSKHIVQDSELSNYDAILGQVFANIDADMEDLAEQGTGGNGTTTKPQVDCMENNNTEKPLNTKEKPYISDSAYGVSENVFSIIEKQNESCFEVNINNQSQSLGRKTSGNTQNILSSQNLPAKSLDRMEIIDPEHSTPVQNIEDSDESIQYLEETPQKSGSLLKIIQKNVTNIIKHNTIKNKSLKLKRADTNIQEADSQNMSVINLSDITDESRRNTKLVTIVEAAKPRQTLETPHTITKFVDQIKYKSTPLAKKSLNFDKENTENSEVEPDQTLCPSLYLVAKTTQEKEFMSKAFEDSPNPRSKSPLTTRNPKMRRMKYCLAGSCLTPSEISNIKLLCSLRDWKYVDKYSPDLSHLVVGVDEERKSERSVKYMCALAAGKWIVSYDWVEKCLQMKTVVDEEPFEALDCTGEPGPRRSRVAKQKLFRGITFFCMPPFSVLDVETLKRMLEAAGGRVVDELDAVRVTGSSPALLLAEPEHTQENRFYYLPMQCIVPVNYEWVLNCLGSYTISSIQELLLCSPSLLPQPTAQWPPELMAKDDD